LLQKLAPPVPRAAVCGGSSNVSAKAAAVTAAAAAPSSPRSPRPL
jgi:hypothetical protein